MNKKYVTDLLVELVPVLTRRIAQYHELFTLPLIAEQWEETLHRSLLEIGRKTTWKAERSHCIGEDMRLVGVDRSRISCKSGQFQNVVSLNKRCVRFNGSRSTSFATLEEKIAHFSASHDDYYFLLAKEKKFYKQYNLLVFPSDICKVDKLSWGESASKKTWNGTGEFSSVIGKSMSSQLWTSIPIEMIPHKIGINI